MPSDRYISWSVGATKGFKRAAMKPEVPLAGYPGLGEDQDMPLYCRSFWPHRILFWRPTPYRNSTSSGPAGRRPRRRCCRAGTRQLASGTNATRAASSSRIGPDTTRHKRAGAPASPHLIAHRVTWSCSPAWKWQSKHRSFRQIRKRIPSAASNCQDFFPGGLP